MVFSFVFTQVLKCEKRIKSRKSFFIDWLFSYLPPSPSSFHTQNRKTSDFRDLWTFKNPSYFLNVFNQSWTLQEFCLMFHFSLEFVHFICLIFSCNCVVIQRKGQNCRSLNTVFLVFGISLAWTKREVVKLTLRELLMKNPSPKQKKRNTQ